MSKKNSKTPSKKTEQSTKKRQPTKKLGDAVEAVTKATGIKAVVDFFTPSDADCGCDSRRQELNEAGEKMLNSIKNLFTKEIQRGLWKEEYDILTPIMAEWEKGDMSRPQAKKVWEIHRQVFYSSYKNFPSCGKCIASMANELEKIYKEYA